MENRKFIKFLIPIFVLGFFVANFNSAFAYGIETHAYLTSELVRFYNQNFPNNKISDELKAYLIDGSRREDDVPRWMNHFYDPVYNRGLTDSVLGTWQKSKDWAQDSNNQNSLTYKVPATIALILTAIQQIKISVLTTETDFTWQRAIKFYVQGEKEKAMFILGHTLHLIEDKAVSDHTRNDPHPGDSPYEKYTQKFTLSNPDTNLNPRLLNKSPIILSNLNSYFDELAKYSNNNFYSKDTIGIQSGYNIPQPDYETKIDKYFYPVKIDKEFGDYYLFRKSIPDILLSTKFDATLEPDIILDAYWSRLSIKSIQYGAGVINLFFQEAEKAKNDPNFAKTEEKSILAKAFEATKNLFAQVGDFFSGIIGAGQDFQEVGQVVLKQPSDIQPSQVKNQYPKSEVQTLPKIDVESPKVNQQNQLQITPSPKTNNQQIEENEEIPQQTEEQIEQQEEIQQATSSPQQTQQTANFKQCAFQTNQSPSRQKIIINEVAWMGMPPRVGETATQAANNEWIELKNISGDEVDLTNWRLIDQGEQIKINLASINGNKIVKPGQFILLERTLKRTDDNTVLNIAADFIYTGALSNTNEGLRLFDSQCNLIDEVLANPKWPAGDNTTKQTMERKSDLSWQTSAQPGGTPKAANSSGYVSYGGGGGGSTNQQQITPASQPAKILISEIQITAGPGKTENDFIELYNPNDFQVNLNGYRLVKRTKTGTSDTLIKSWTSDAFIPAHSFYLWANSNYADIPNTPDVTTSQTISNDNGIAIRFGSNDTGTIIDSVAWGGAQNAFIEGSVFPINPGANQSIQRKFHPSTSSGFIDTDNNANDFEMQTCPSPKAKTCQQANQAPSAFFVYAPLNPQAGETITFNAASSSDPDPDDQIVLYQWDFGDGQATTTQATTTYSYYSYSTPGNYTVRLTVFDNQNASSDATSTTILVSNSGNIVISEIQVRGDAADDEFIELYNPTNNAVPLSGYSIQYLSGTATSTEKIKKKNFKRGAQIPAKGFYLIVNSNAISSLKNKADISYSSFSLSGDSSGATIFLVSATTSLLSIDDTTIIDSVSYGNPQLATSAATSTVPGPNKSLERKAFYNNQCATASGSGEFLGNGCDNDSADDFEIRNTPNPQNSLSFPEPRSAPTIPGGFTVKYNSSTMELVFGWQPSQDYPGATSTLTYRITDISNSSSTLSTIETASTTAKTSINEVGRVDQEDYRFFIQAFDSDGLGSATSAVSTTVPSFFSGLYFYQDSRDNNKNLIEAYYNQYPFIPDLYYNPTGSSWKLVVFYLNSEPEKQLNIDTLPYQPTNLENVLAVKYKHCSGGSITKENSLLLPDISDRCGTQGDAQNIGFAFTELEDNHFIIQTASSSQELNLNSNDFLSVAFYSTYWIGVGPIPRFRLVAVDKIKYYFSQTPSHQPPQFTGQINLNFDRPNSRLNIDWPKATDPDTLDSLLTYEIQYATLTGWESLVGNATGTTKIVAPGDNFSISVRAKDDFGNYSSILTTNWFYPPTIFYINQTATSTWSDNFGYKDSNNTAYLNLQSIMSTSTFQFNKVVLRIKQTGANDFAAANDSANLKLSVYSDNGNNYPNFNNQLSNAVISDIYNPNENQDITFNFNNLVSVTNNNKYWLVLEVESYIGFNIWTQWDRNRWKNAIDGNNPYSGGEAGKITINNSVYGSISINSNSDWYMKIGLEQ
jgi:hypothetical protein